MMIGDVLLIIGLIFLILVSAFFSGAETGLMTLNRYRLQHLLHKGDKGAKRISSLLLRPDRLLGVLLIGNTFSNIFASAAVTLLAERYFGSFGVLIATILLTLIVLIFGETAPKTLAALHPEAVAWPSSLILKWLLKLLYPLVWLVNGIANGFLRLFGVKMDVSRLESLSLEELRTLLSETKGKISSTYQKTLLRILDLEQVNVESIMVPKNEIFGIDLENGWEEIEAALMECTHAFVPVYRENINNVLGILNLRKVLVFLRKGNLDKISLMNLADEVYFIPQEATANQQLLNFRDQQQTIGLVVDEYGDIQGLITVTDIMEEIVGEFTKDVLGINRFIIPQKDGSFLIDASVDVRDLNALTEWKLPTEEARTLSGLIIEQLEMIPMAGICVRIGGYPLEVMRVSRNRIKLVKVFPQLFKELSSWEQE